MIKLYVTEIDATDVPKYYGSMWDPIFGTASLLGKGDWIMLTDMTECKRIAMYNYMRHRNINKFFLVTNCNKRCSTPVKNGWVAIVKGRGTRANIRSVRQKLKRQTHSTKTAIKGA